MRIAVKPICAFGDLAVLVLLPHPVHMVRRIPQTHHFIRAWRKARGLTLEQLAERIGMSHQNLGKIERGKVPYTQTLLELLAGELRCDPRDLIMRDPSDPDGLWSIYDQLEPVQRRQVVEIAKTLKRTGTND